MRLNVQIDSTPYYTCVCPRTLCMWNCDHVALSPGSNVGAGGKRDPGIHCLYMPQLLLQGFIYWGVQGGSFPPPPPPPNPPTSPPKVLTVNTIKNSGFMFFRALVIDTPKWAYGTSKTLHASHTIDLCTQSSPPNKKF